METRKLSNFINGKSVPSQGDATLELVDPATEQVYALSPISTAADVDAAYQAADAAFEGWKETTPGERQLALFRIADEMEKRAEEFADLESQDTGKPRGSLVDDEIMLSVDQIRFFAGAARNLEGRSAGEYMKDHTSMIRREPIGVIGQVTPWNYLLTPIVIRGTSPVARNSASASPVPWLATRSCWYLMSRCRPLTCRFRPVC